MRSSSPLYLPGANGVQLAATSFGEGSNGVVVLLHGAGQTRHSWRNAGNELASSGWQVLTIDTRGHGESEWPSDGDYSIDTLKEDLSIVATRLTESHGCKPVLVGASLGGITGLLVEGESSASVFESLVLVDITPRIDNTGVARIIEFMRRYEQGFASLEEAAAAVAAYKTGSRPRNPSNVAAQSTGLKKNLRRGQDGRYYWHWDPRLMDHIGTIDDHFYQRQSDAAQKLTLPVLLVRGQQSEIVSRDAVTEFLELVPHARYTDIEDAAHMVAGDSNDVFIQSVLDFIGC